MTAGDCPTGKRRYLTWTHAQFDARAMRRHKSNGSNRERPYHCSTCSGFHIGQHVRTPRRMKEL